MISTASPPPLRIPPNRQDTPPAEPAKKFKSLRLALYGSNPGYPTGTGSSVNLRVGLAGTKDKRRQRTAQQVSSTRGRSARPMKISGVLALGPKLGPLLWQLPPILPFDRGRMTDFFHRLPATTGQAAKIARSCDDRLGRRFNEEPVT